MKSSRMRSKTNNAKTATKRVFASVARRGFEPLTSSLKGMRSREAAQRVLHAPIDTGIRPRRTADKGPYE